MNMKLFSMMMGSFLLLGFLFVSCDANTNDSIVYESAKDDTTYKLELTKNTSKKAFTPAGGDSFKMTITKAGSSSQTSSGSIQSVSSNTFTLAHKSGGTFTVTANVSAGMTDISGTIPIDDSTTQITAPGAVTPKSGEPGNTDVKMAGTTWKGEQPDSSTNRVYVGVISFTSASNATIQWTWKDDGSDAGHDSGTYTVNGNNVTLYFADGVTTVTVNNNKFVFHGTTFFKQ